MGCGLLGSSVHGILQARIMEWVAVPFSRESSKPRDQTQVSCISDSFFTIWVTREVYAAAKSLQSCPTLCSPIDGCPPGYPVPGILQARTHCLLQCRKVKSESEVAQSCLTSRPHGLQLTRLLHPYDFPGKSTGVGCHCLLQNKPSTTFYI